MIEFLSTGYPPGTEEKLPWKVTSSERHFENQLPPKISSTAQLLKSSRQVDASNFFPALLIDEKLLLEASLATLKPGKCTVTLSWCLAPVEVVIEAPKTMPGVTTVPPAFRLGISACQEKVKQAWLVLSRSWGLEDTVNYPFYLPSAAQPCSHNHCPSLRLTGSPCQGLSIRSTCLPNPTIKDFNGFCFYRVLLCP